MFCYPGDKVEKEFMYEKRANSKYADYDANDGLERLVDVVSSKRHDSKRSSKTKSDVLDKYSWWNKPLTPPPRRKRKTWRLWSWWRPRSASTRRTRR